jgi:hypothetical protein
MAGLDTARNKELAACVVTLRGSVQVAAVEPAQGTLHDEYLVKVIDAMKVWTCASLFENVQNSTLKPICNHALRSGSAL